MEFITRRLKSNKVQIKTENFSEGEEENFVGRLNEYAQSLKKPFPKYVSKKMMESHPPIIEIVCSWAEMTEQTFKSTSENKQQAKRESARQMMIHINSLN